ncbi:MAG: type II secretion system protein K [Lysobacteraceae bacterium]|nr:MAG: type II secretion system protein K [Xanthomonadaceae bacterium]
MNGATRQGGIALLAAIVVVALGTVLVAALLDLGESARARSRNALRAEQSWQLALGAELWAADLLRQDEQARQGFDAPGDLWTRMLPPVPLPNGRLSGSLRDAGACLDVNLLADPSRAPLQRQRLARLLRALRLDPALEAAISDFVDEDGRTRPGGAEDGAYLRRRPPLRAPNRPLVHVSELRLVEGMDAETWGRLRPHLCALPEPAPMNLNFIGPELWMSLFDGLSEQVARQLWRDGQAHYQSLDEVEAEALRLGLGPLPREGLGLYSTWFVLELEVDVDGLPFQYAALMQRGPGGATTRMRLRGRW